MKKECINKYENEQDCPCSHVDDCEYHGICCECIRYHRNEEKNLPVCLRNIK